MFESTYFFWIASNATIFEDAKSAITGAFRMSSARDLISVPVRTAGKLDQFVVRTVPNYILRHSGVESWTAQAGQGLNAYMDAGVGGINGVAAQAAARSGTVMTGWKALLAEAIQAGTLKSYGGMLSYLTSRWAFTCFAMALVLNRVHVYASSRQRIHLTWNKRFALRLVPVMLFIAQIHKLLQAIQCQSSPDFVDLRFGTQNASETPALGLEWQNQDGFSHWLASTALFTSSDADSCAAREMSSPSPGVKAPLGSYSLLWPTFVRICLSHFLETISCSLQQTPVMTEIAMSVFEHSLAFAEVEIMITQTLGVTSTKIRKRDLPSNITVTEVPLSGVVLSLADAIKSITGSHRLDRTNVPVEVSSSNSGDVFSLCSTSILSASPLVLNQYLANP